MADETATMTFDQAAAEASKSYASQTVDSPSDGATEPATTTQTAEPTTAETPTAEAAEEGLLTQEEVSRLSETDRATYRRMNQAFTQKTQKLAEERKQIQQIKEAFETFQTDPQGAIKEWARHYGVKLAEEAEAAKDPQGQAAQIQGFNTLDRVKSKLRALLPGEENQPLADGLAQILADEVEQTVRQNVDPIKAQQEAAMMEAARASTEADFEALGTRHPDWKEHEAKMVEIGRQWTPAPGMPVDKYLDTLYRLATLDESEAARTNKVLDRIHKAVSSAEPSPGAAVNTSRVTPARPAKASIEDAFRAAKQGISWS